MRRSSWGTTAAALGSGALLWLTPAAGTAACLPSPVVDGTNCAVFLPDTDSLVHNTYRSFNLQQATAFQLSGFTTASQPVTLDALAWSRDGLTWTPWSTPQLVIDNSGDLAYSPIVNLGEAIGSPLHLRYTIAAPPQNPPGTFTTGDVVSTILLANANGYTRLQPDSSSTLTVPVLSRQAGNGFLAEQRDHQDAPQSVPGPLPLLGALAGLTTARRLRRRCRAAGLSH